MTYRTDNFQEWNELVAAGDKILLSGKVYTARDAAHKRIFECLKKGEALPIEIDGAFIYYAGPTPVKNGLATGACGPTTSSRMDVYTPRLMELGLAATIGKGPRSEEVVESIAKHKGLYLCAVGGAGALAAKCIKSVEVIAYDELGCESIKSMVFEDFPLYVGIDSRGDTIFRYTESENNVTSLK